MDEFNGGAGGTTSKPNDTAENSKLQPPPSHEIEPPLESIRVFGRDRDSAVLMRVSGGKIFYNRITETQITYLIESAAEALRKMRSY